VKFINILHLLSLDIAAGAVAGSLFAAEIIGVEMNFSFYLILFLATLVVYSTDHLLDGFRKKGKTASNVHRLFYNYRYPVIILTLFIAVLSLRLAFYTQERIIIEYGFLIAGVIIVYFLINTYYQKVERVIFVKELWIGLIYVFAVIGGPVLILDSGLEPVNIMLFSSYGLLVLSNVFTYSYFECERDKEDQEKTLATIYGRTICRRIIIFCLATASILLLTALIIYPGEKLLNYLVIFFIILIISIIQLFENYFKRTGNYGLVADFAFLIPFIILFFS
jgi:4-hydroxybenzoate polyprenyltransferase